MSNDLGSQVYNLTMQNLVTLWVIDFTGVIDFDTATDGILRVTSYRDGNNNIVFGTNTYEYVGVQGSGFRSEINGQLPEPTVVFDKQSLTSLPKYQTIRNEYTSQTGEVYFDWRGARITRIRTTSNYLDNGSTPDTSKADEQDFLVDQVTRSTSSTIEVALTVSVAADSLTADSIQTLAANRCALSYRMSKGSSFDYVKESAGGCPYGNPTTVSDWDNVPEFGDLYFDANDNETTKENDVCSYSVKGCMLRFDPEENGLTLPYTGTYKPTGTASNG